MADRTFHRVAERIGEHATAHGLSRIRAVLHGGEPLLVGGDGLASMAAQLRAVVPEVEVEVTVQTNAVRLTPRDLDLFAAQAIMVGVSLDGDRRANDRHRRRANGRSTFDAVHRALELLRRRPEVFAGILCVVDLANDPVAVYQALVQYAPPRVDFLLPHANWSAPPPGGSEEPRYGAWLAAAFDRWYGARARETGVRLFDELIHLVLGGQSRTEAIGLTPAAVIVFNVDGSYEDIDTLRSAYLGAVDTGLNAFEHPLDEAMRHPAVLASRQGLAGLAEECRRCPVHRICGGGYYPHRYRAGTGFRNPSVYSRDLRYLIEHVAGRLRADLARTRGQELWAATTD
jgi:uncharacterized protein